MIARLLAILLGPILVSYGMAAQEVYKFSLPQEYPNELTMGTDGSFYATTANGGTGDYGTVFRITTNRVLTTLLSFSSNNGANPFGGLTRGTDGAFYGTTAYGGSSNKGAIFRITTNGTLTTLRSFAGTNGSMPYGGLALGTDAAFCGTTYAGGINDLGTVF